MILLTYEEKTQMVRPRLERYGFFHRQAVHLGGGDLRAYRDNYHLSHLNNRGGAAPSRHYPAPASERHYVLYWRNRRAHRKKKVDGDG